MTFERNFALESKIEAFYKKNHTSIDVSWTVLKHRPGYMTLVDDCIAAGVFPASDRDDLNAFSHEQLYCAMLDPLSYGIKYCAGAKRR